ncbi:MAG: universal stress protein [Eubacteriales bacterium]|nr:universal stress protein [Eubacteriales bacterium]
MLKLLLPIDGSERSKRSVDWVKARYAPEDVEITLLLIREDLEEQRSREQFDLAKAELLPLLNEIAASLPEFKVKPEVRFGRAGEEILNYAKAENIDTIVMTKSTKEAWVRFIGSVTTHVVKYASCIVVIVPENKTKHECTIAD